MISTKSGSRSRTCSQRSYHNVSGPQIQFLYSGILV